MNIDHADRRLRAELPSPVVLRRIEEMLVADLRPVRPLASNGRLFAVFAALFAAIVALGVYRMGAFALGVMSPLQAGVMLGSLTAGASLLAWALAQHMAPGSRYRVSPVVLLAGIVVSLAALSAVLFTFEYQNHFWERAWRCIRAGGSTGILAALPVWLVLRRGAMLSPRLTGATAGLFAGLAGTTMLQVHCPNLRAGHILVAHLGVAVGGAMIGFVAGAAAEAFRRRSEK